MANARPKILLSWSSGKDSAWALHILRQKDDVDVVGLLTTVNEDARRVAMHAVRETLVDAQAHAAGLPLTKVFIPEACNNQDYDAAMRAALTEAQSKGITGVAFGDLFLEDIRAYRETRMAEIGLKPLFPLWGSDTPRLARDMVRAGLAACVTSVDTKQLDPGFLGRIFDDSFLDDLPEGVDPCGENGEFHSFAYRGPMFDIPLSITAGETVERGQFVYADLLPTSDQADDDRAQVRHDAV